VLIDGASEVMSVRPKDLIGETLNAVDLEPLVA